ncbi:MAG: hypothetical protein RL026_1908 [Pseudomonadota bacterium]
MNTRMLLGAALLGAVLAGCGGQPAAPAAGAVDDARLMAADSEPQNWLAHGGNLQAQRFSRLTQITPDNIGGLKPAWFLEVDTNRGQEATPIVVDGVIYVSTAWSKVYAVDGRTGAVKWQHDPQVPGAHAAKNCCDVVSRGVAVYQGKVFVGTFDGRLQALDAATGKLLWSTATFDPDSMHTISGAPRVGAGLVFVGNSGGEFGGRGFVSAYKADTGELAWRFFLTPGEPGTPDGAASDPIMETLVQPSWPGKHNGYRGGANAWNAMVYDPSLGHLYLATGNGYPWLRTFRSEGKGDNLFINSVVALDAKTGAYKWHYQETPGDIWDYDSVADMILADLTIDGEQRPVLMHTPKNGFFYTLDRRDGKLLSAPPFVEGINWASKIDLATGRPVENPLARYDERKAPFRASPGEGGGHAWAPTAFDPTQGLFFLSSWDHSSALHIPKPTFEYSKGLDNIGTYHFATHAPGEAPPPGDPTAKAPQPWLMAWDPVAQKPRWKTPGAGNGVMATAGGLVFQGFARDGVLGRIAAFRSDTGEQVWSHDTPNAIPGGIVSYAIDDEQYVLAISGSTYLAPAGSKVRARHPGRLVAFKLGGTATLPPEAPEAGPVVVVDTQWPKDVVAKGSELYLTYCARCHWMEAQSSGVVPNLRRSPVLADAKAWEGIVLDGALANVGMISFKPWLPEGGAEAIRAYVATKAREEAGK